MLCVGCLSSDWLVTDSLPGIQFSSLRETVMIITFTSVVFHLILTKIIVIHANRLVKAG